MGFKLIYPEEEWGELFFFTAITLSTVGYEDFLGIRSNPLARLYTMTLIITGMGIVLYSVSAVTAFVIEGNLKEIFRDRSMKRKIAHYQNHYIICGSGQTGIHVVREMVEMKHQVVIIEHDAENCEKLREEFPGLLILNGDATSDETLIKANIKNAAGLIATLSVDKDNLFLTLTGRMLNSRLKIVSRAVDLNMQAKLFNAGANYVVSPNFIGGMRIASEILRPHVVTFLDRMLRGKSKDIRVQEVKIPEGSRIIGRTILETAIREKTGLNIIAYSPTGRDEDFVYNPCDGSLLEKDGVLLFIGGPEDMKKMKKMID